MKTTKAHDERIANMKFATVYPHYGEKVEKKGRARRGSGPRRNLPGQPE